MLYRAFQKGSTTENKTFDANVDIKHLVHLLNTKRTPAVHQMATESSSGILGRNKPRHSDKSEIFVNSTKPRSPTNVKLNRQVLEEIEYQALPAIMVRSHMPK